MSNYRKHADEYIRLIAKNYTQSRVNADVRGFVRGFAKYLETSIVTEQIRNASSGGIAIITENINHTTGGRYYTWQVAYALAEAGFKVTIYTDGKPSFAQYFSDYKLQPSIEIIGSKSTDLSSANIKADAYIGSPIHGNISAIKNAIRYEKPCYAMIFDPLPMIEAYRNKKGFQGWEELVDLIRKNQSVKIITLSRSIHSYIHDWLDRTEDKLVPIYPCVNDIAIEQAGLQDERDFVLFVSRLVPNKKLEDVLGACKDNRVNLKVIYSASGIDHKRMTESAGMTNRVEFIKNPSDVEKFALMKQSRAVINGAIYEGFGMWLAEAISCGVPAVCYQYPTFTEIRNHALADNVYMAKWNDKKSLAHKLRDALAENKRRAENDAFHFAKMVHDVKGLF